VQRLIDEVKPKYRDAHRYQFTALTGKDVRDAEPQDHEFALIAAMILGSK
jgi:hypothetical protein